MNIYRRFGFGLVSVLVLGLAGAMAAEAQSAGFRMDTGLHTFTPGETLRVVVTELGPTTTARVRINVFDEQETRVSTKLVDLRRGTPALLDLRIGGTVSRLLRVQAIFTNATESVPIMTFESIELDLTIGTRVICARPAGRTDPPTSASCPGVVITDLAVI